MWCPTQSLSLSSSCCLYQLITGLLSLYVLNICLFSDSYWIALFFSSNLYHLTKYFDELLISKPFSQPIFLFSCWLWKGQEHWELSERRPKCGKLTGCIFLLLLTVLALGGFGLWAQLWNAIVILFKIFIYSLKFSCNYAMLFAQIHPPLPPCNSTYCFLPYPPKFMWSPLLFIYCY